MRESTVEITASNLRNDTTKVSPEELTKMKALADDALRVLNKLEGFAIPLVVGVADDGIGFVECGRTYLQLFEKFCLLLPFTKKQQTYLSIRPKALREMEKPDCQAGPRHGTYQVCD